MSRALRDWLWVIAIVSVVVLLVTVALTVLSGVSPDPGTLLLMGLAGLLFAGSVVLLTSRRTPPAGL